MSCVDCGVLQGKGRTASNKLYSEAMLAFHCHLQDPDEAVARECR